MKNIEPKIKKLTTDILKDYGQGRTIDKVHLALGKGAFETGQTYVALSRCPTLDGLSFSRELKSADVLVDTESVNFYQQLRAGNVFNSP